MEAESADSQHRAQRTKKGEKNFAFRVYSWIVVPLIASMAKIEIIDGEKLPKRGAYVLAPNHFSEIDPLIMAVAVWKMGRAPRFLAKASLFKVPVVGFVLRTTGQIPVYRQQAKTESQPLKEAEAIIEKEAVVIVYPEGTLTRDPDLWPMRGKSGAVRLARAANIPIIPVAHWGTNDLMPRYSKKLRCFPRKKITIKVGDPIPAEEFAQADNATKLKTSTDRVMAEISALVSDLRGEPAPKERWNPEDHNQAETGRM